jgi:predicted permease
MPAAGWCSPRPGCCSASALPGWCAKLAGVEGVLRGVILIQSTMPVAVFNYLLAQTYRQGPETVAAMVVFSTLLSFLTLPLLLMVALP